MIIKITLSVFGNEFYPETIIKNITNNLVVTSYWSPNDRNEFIDEEYGFGTISFWHTKKFATSNNWENYEKEFVQFLELNNQLFIENGASSITVYMEIYYDGIQCNFEILNKELLKKIANLDVSIPVSVYLLKKRALQRWEKEIELDWK